MAKTKTFDPITVGIVAATLIVILVLLINAGVLGPQESVPKIAILDTNTIIESLPTNPDNEYMMNLKEKIDQKTELLKEQGFIVLKSEIVRGAPGEFYVSIEE